MQDPQQRLGARQPAFPVIQANQHQRGGNHGDDGRQGFPAGYQGCHQQDHRKQGGHIQPRNHFYRLGVATALAQPAGSERRCDAAADDADQRQSHNQRAVAKGHIQPGNEADLHQPQQAQNDHNHGLAFLAGMPYSPSGIDHHQWQKSQVNALNHPVRQVSTQGQQQATGQPHAPEQRQGKAVGAFCLRPDTYSGQQKAGNGRRQKTEQHFMLVPEQGRHGQWQLQNAGDFQNPDRYGHKGQYRHRQEENPERIGK